MLQFREFAVADRALLEPILFRQPYRLCDHSFACCFIWQENYHTRWCLEDDILYIRYGVGGEVCYQLPLNAGDRLPRAIARLEEDAAANGARLLLVVLNDRMREELEAAMPGAFSFTQDRDGADYIYDAEALRELTGKRLHAKRNYINRFISENEGAYAFEEITPENAAEVLAFNGEWDREHGMNIDYLHEADAIRNALDNLRALGMQGVALRLDGKLIAFALGVRLSEDTVLEQFEKALPVPGAYQIINREFARRFSTGCSYINREEDLGLEGLRKAKLSYFPAWLNMRWRAVRND